ncbi:hypothetical protein [Alteribacter aurantiacus]|uniref:hypothetical protein n=1 Tax=Alteribacter aurantiacus TaxID=254410 RepID=UPI00040A40CA|nr:hypothetical protein [Alteribacter aurantiacus]
MDRKQASFIVDFEQMKKKKQTIYEQALMDVYGLLFSYVEKHANLREKVRAKHLFTHKAGLSNTQLDKTYQLHFEHWFVFDYVTVIGSRVFDMFVRESKNDLTKPMLDLCGHLMLMTLEPVKVNKVSGESITVERLITGVEQEVQCFLISPNVTEGDYGFMRLAPVGFSTKIIGPGFSIDQREVNRVEKQVNDAIDSHPQDVENVKVKRFLKEYGIDFIRYASRI